ncbi:response regulator [Botrimarina sp.]|uniref:response regulator n=1 Tax=Botrimarina sp. TaxID=2795802 RepID=UPI0032ED6E36
MSEPGVTRRVPPTADHGERPEVSAQRSAHSGDAADAAASPTPAADAAGSAECTGPEGPLALLCLCDDPRDAARLAQRLAGKTEVTAVRSLARALSRLATGEYAGVYAAADHFGPASDATQLIHNVQMLRAMPDGVVLLGRDTQVVWSNGRLREWTGRDRVVGENFYSVLGAPEILGPEFKPLDAALSSGSPAATTLRCEDGKYYRMHAAPIECFQGEKPEHLVVTIRDVTAEQLEQQKLNAIHQAGIELADLTPEEVAEMSVEERIDLLKANILHCTQDVLHYDVVEVRTLDEETGELCPLLAVGIKPEAERRPLHCETTGNGVTGFVAATGKSYLCEDTGGDPLYIEGAQGARSSLTVPLLLHDRVIGTFNVESPEAGAFTESDRQFLEIFTRDVAAALNTMQLLEAEKATTAVASVEAIHSAVAMPVDDILNDAVNLMDRYLGQDPEIAEPLQRILRNARDIKKVIQEVGQSMAPAEARPMCVRVEERPLLVGKRVLVADEDDSVRSAAHELLERYGCVVEAAHDGKEALVMARNAAREMGGGATPYDAILADIALPDVTGYELLQQLEAEIGPPPLILMTGFGYDPGHTIVKARQAGLKAVLYKPFRLDQLLETVELVASRNAAPAQSADA